MNYFRKKRMNNASASGKAQKKELWQLSEKLSASKKKSGSESCKGHNKTQCSSTSRHKREETPRPYTATSEDYGQLLQLCQLDIEPNSPVFYQANKLLVDYLIAAQRIVLHRVDGDVFKETEDLQRLFPLDSPTIQYPEKAITELPANTVIPSAADVQTESPPNSLPTTPLLTDIFNMWEREHLKSGKPQNTAHEYRLQTKRFCGINGDLPIDEIKPVHARNFKNAMLNFPIYCTRYKELTTKELVQMFEADSTINTLSPKSINGKCLAAIKAVLGYAQRNGYIENNPARDMKVTEGK